MFCNCLFRLLLEYPTYRLGEISDLLTHPLRSTSQLSGPTFYSDKKELTYYIAARKSGNHTLAIGRSKNIFDKLSKFLDDKGYDVEQGGKGNVRILSISCEVIAEIINVIESDFKPQ